MDLKEIYLVTTCTLPTLKLQLHVELAPSNSII